MERLKKKLIKFWLNQNNQVRLFCRAALQLTLIALNTYQLANKHYLGSIIVGFLISLVWTFNVKSAAFGSLNDKIVYALGASVGTGIGLLFSTIIYS